MAHRWQQAETLEILASTRTETKLAKHPSAAAAASNPCSARVGKVWLKNQMHPKVPKFGLACSKPSKKVSLWNKRNEPLLPSFLIKFRKKGGVDYSQQQYYGSNAGIRT